MELRPSQAYKTPMMILTLGLYSFWHKRTLYSVTSERVRTEIGLFNRMEEEVPINKITSVALDLKMSPGTSAVQVATGAGDKTLTIGKLNRHDARLVADRINELRINL
jgi:membrane protein YdbS with pleckstrin-like domain